LYYIYQGGMQNGFSNNSFTLNSFGNVLDLRDNSTAFSASIRQFGSIFLFKNALFDFTQFQGFQFDAYITSGSQQLRCGVDSGSINSSVMATKNLIFSSSTQWQTYRVYWTDQGVTNNWVSGNFFKSFEICNLLTGMSQSLVINNVALLSGTISGSSVGTGSGGTTGSGGGSGGGVGTGSYGIYVSGVLQNGWQNNNNYGGTYAYVADSRYPGFNCLRGTFNQYGGMNFGSLNGSTIKVNNYTAIVFDAYADAATALRVQLDPGDNTSPIIYKTVTITTGSWKTYTLSYTDPSVTNESYPTTTFTNFEIVSFNTQPTANVYVNNIQLTINPNPPTASFSMPATDPSPASASAGWLYCRNQHFYLSGTAPAGSSSLFDKMWMGRGCNIFDTHMDGKTYSLQQTTVVTEWIRRVKFAADQGVNFCRFLLEMRNSADDITTNADYLLALKQCVNYLGTRNVHAIINCQIDYTDDPYPGGQLTVATYNHLAQIATSFRNCGHVLIGLCNEPVGNDTPQLKQDYMDVVSGAISAIRQTEARDGAKPKIIVVQGPSNYSRYSVYFTTNPAVDGYYPNSVSGAINYIAYEHHCYEAQQYWGGGDFVDFKTCASKLPLVIGEFAPGSGQTMTTADITPFMNYCESASIPYNAWSFDYNSPPDMLVNSSSTSPSTTVWGANMRLQWNAWGLQYINNVRAAIGSASVDAFGA
jgi:hypothetical protein